MLRQILVAAFVSLYFSAAAFALNPVTWTLDERFSNSNTSWTSPTAVDIGLDIYLYEYEITKADAIVLGFPVSVLGDLSDFVTDEGKGQLPAVLIDRPVSYESDLGDVSLDLFVEIASDGFARAQLSNIVLPSLVSGIDLAATINVKGFKEGDLNSDGEVDLSDWHVFAANSQKNLSAYSLADRYARGDLDVDGDNDYADFRAFKAIYTAHHPTATFAAPVSVPEPSTLGLLLSGLLVFRRP